MMNSKVWIVPGLMLLILLNTRTLPITSAEISQSSIQKNTIEWVFPAEGIVSDIFSSREGSHKGIDIAGAESSSVYAVDDGTVSKSYYSSTYGNVIFVKHPNGFETIYAHLEKRLVSKGSTVAQGEEIGTMGNTGDSSGSHLHFEVHHGEWTIDKENAFDPFTVFGHGEIGDRTYALERKFVETVEVAAQPADVQPEQAVHVVQKGETVWSISQKFSTTVATLKELNHLDQTYKIAIGDKLLIK